MDNTNRYCPFLFWSGFKFRVKCCFDVLNFIYDPESMDMLTLIIEKQMNQMKKYLTIVFSVITLMAAAQHQEMKPHHGKGKHQKEQLMQQLQLTDAQQQSIKASNLAFKEQLTALNKNEQISVKEFRDKKDELQKAHKAKVMSILTEGQKEQLNKLKSERKAEHEAKADHKIEKLKNRLQLTDDQVAHIKADRIQISNQMEAIHNNEQLSRVDKKAQLDQLKEQKKGILKKYLNTQQLAQMEQMKKEHNEHAGFKQNQAPATK